MAPILKILVEWLPNLPTALRLPNHVTHLNRLPNINEAQGQLHQQQLLDLPRPGHMTGKANQAQVSSVSWGINRLDIFVAEASSLKHKYWDGYTWKPEDDSMETLGQGLATPPSAVTWGVDHLDVFGVNTNNRIAHQYWNGSDWNPSPATFDELGGECDPAYNLAVSSWGVGRIDVFCRALGSAHLYHQYYDGSSWSGIEDFGYYLQQEPTVLTSWGKDRIDVFFLNGDAQITHLYWTGNEWRDESEVFTSPKGYKWDTLTTSSWGKGRLDLFAAGPDSGLWHMFYDGYQWIQWESLSAADDEPVGQVSVATWPNHFEVAIESRKQKQYLYKYYDESSSWQPSVKGWYVKSAPFAFDSKPSVTSWAPGRVDIVGQTPAGSLMHQAWTGNGWYPGDSSWEYLSH
ncbi:MAG: hypothetical protein Q9220_002682 [cf. Caloplaca sp. 1 TL-2023]